MSLVRDWGALVIIEWVSLVSFFFFAADPAGECEYVEHFWKHLLGETPLEAFTHGVSALGITIGVVSGGSNCSSYLAVSRFYLGSSLGSAVSLAEGL
jgi:hypothetical protein